MQNEKSEYTLQDENALFSLAVISVLGDRDEQQDRAGYELKDREGLAVVCDGMGGHAGGRTASTLAMLQFLTGYLKENSCEDMHSLLMDMAADADKAVSCLKDEEGNKLGAGSTVSAVFIREDSLYWLSVGDSRIYLYRDGEMICVTTDHVYKNVLQYQLEAGEIDEEAYESGIENGEALVSFLGVNGLPFIDANEKPLHLKSGDRIILATDGLYKLVPEEGIKNIVMNFGNIGEALKALEQKAKQCAKGASRDNMTACLIKIK